MIAAIPLGMMMVILAAMSNRNDLGALGSTEDALRSKIFKIGVDKLNSLYYN